MAGILEDSHGAPVSGARVHLRSADYVPPPDSGAGIGTAIGLERDTLTGPDGEFSFALGPADTGAFLIDAQLGETGLRAPFRRGSGQAVYLGKVALAPTGTLYGSVALPTGDAGDARVIVLGTHAQAYFARGSGEFSFPDLPAGKYVLRVSGIRPERPPVDVSADLPAGNSTRVDLVAAAAAPGGTGAVSLRLERPGIAAGALRARLGAEGEILTADSSGKVDFPSVPPGVYAAYAWGENPARDTVRLDGIEVRSGRLTVPAALRFKVRALIVDGIDNHDWRRMTRDHGLILGGSGLFQVDVSTSPPEGAPGGFTGWSPRFSDYDVVILHCNSGHDGDDGRANIWPDSIRARLEAFVSGGGGLVNTHGSFPAFLGWTAYEAMRGLAWREKPPLGESYAVDSLGTLSPEPVFADTASSEAATPGGAGERIFTVHLAHPVNAGLPAQWTHPHNQLAYRLKGDPEGITVLAYAIDPRTGERAPQAWTKAYGRGRVFTTTLGHLREGGSEDPLRCAGYQTLLIRGSEWAASGIVTYPSPPDFPTGDSPSLRGNIPQP